MPLSRIRDQLHARGPVPWQAHCTAASPTHGTRPPPSAQPTCRRQVCHIVFGVHGAQVAVQEGLGHCLVKRLDDRRACGQGWGACGACGQSHAARRKVGGPVCAFNAVWRRATQRPPMAAHRWSGWAQTRRQRCRRAPTQHLQMQAQERSAATRWEPVAAPLPACHSPPVNCEDLSAAHAAHRPALHAPALTTRSTSRARLAKSADRMEGDTMECRSSPFDTAR